MNIAKEVFGENRIEKALEVLKTKREKLGIEIDLTKVIPKKEFEIPQCKTCGKVFKENHNIPSNLPDGLKAVMKYIPSCDCREREKMEYEKEMEESYIQAKLNKTKDISLIDSKFYKSTFESADLEGEHMKLAKKYAETLKNKNIKEGLLFTGSVGTGKTFASSCIANELINNGKTVLIINLALYLIKLRTEWDKAESDFLRQVKKCDLLIIDDLGAENITPFVLEKTFNLVDTRYRSEKPLIITSNLSTEEIEGVFKARISDRIKEMCFPISVKGTSKREFNKKAFLESLKI